MSAIFGKKFYVKSAIFDEILKFLFFKKNYFRYALHAMGYCEQLLFNKKIGLIFEIPSLFSDGKFWPNFNFLIINQNYQHVHVRHI